MLMIGGRNYQAYFQSKSTVNYYPITDLYAADIVFPKADEPVVFMGSLELSKRYDSKYNNFSDIFLAKNIKKLKDKKIIFISSSAVYGLSSENVAFTTNSKLCGNSKYALEKINLEALLTSVTNRLVILRPSGFFGELYGFKPRSFLNVLSKNIVLSQRKIYDIEFAGLQFRDFTHVEDLMHCVEHFCSTEITSKQCHNVSSTKPVQLKELTQEIMLSHEKLRFNYIPSDVNKIHSYLKNSDEVEELLPKKRDIKKFLKLA